MSEPVPHHHRSLRHESEAERQRVEDEAPTWLDGVPSQHAPDDETERRQHSFFSELPVLVIVAFVLALLLKTFLVQAFYIPSSSMEPTLLVGDRVLVNKVVYNFRDPQRGDIVVFNQEDGSAVAPDPNPVVRFLRSLATGLGLAAPGERDFIKRVIGLPGDVVAMRAGVVYLNDEPLEEAPQGEGGYLSARDPIDFGPYTVPPGHYFMMGDNRPNSADSRTVLGPIPREAIIGRAFVVIWPLERFEALTPPDYEAAVPRALLSAA